MTYVGNRPATLGKRNDVVRLTYKDGLVVEFEFAPTTARRKRRFTRRKPARARNPSPKRTDMLIRRGSGREGPVHHRPVHQRISDVTYQLRIDRIQPIDPGLGLCETCQLERRQERRQVLVTTRKGWNGTRSLDPSRSSPRSPLSLLKRTQSRTAPDGRFVRGDVDVPR